MQLWIKWTLIFFVIFFILIIPYLLFGNSIENWVNHFLSSYPSKLIVVIVIGGFISIDIIAPMPSSILSASVGYILGFIPGTIISLAGMTISCIIGYFLGAKFGNPISEKLVGNDELMRLEKIQFKYGNWMIILLRAVPVLAEASILVAGIGRMPMKRFISLILLSNLGISLVYAYIGAYSAHLNTFLMAFAGAILIPAIAMVILRFKGINSIIKFSY